MKLSANIHGPGNADQVILADQITRGGGGKLSEILVGKIMGVTFVNGVAVNLRRNSKMSIVIDGAIASPNMLDDINPYDVYSIEVLRTTAYTSVYGADGARGLLIITLKHGKDNTNYASITVDGLITHVFDGFYRTREFYTPKYNVQTVRQPNDDRSTIYWNPDIITTNGKASIEYYNAGSPATYRVVIEGIDGNGNLCRQVFKYQVGL